MLGQLERTQQVFDELREATTGRQPSSPQAMPFTKPEIETEQRIQTLEAADPEANQLEIHELKALLNRQKALSERVAGLTSEYTALINRLCYHKSISFTDKLFHAVGLGESTEIPKIDELIAFIKKVRSASQEEYGDELDVDTAFSELIENTSQLGHAIGICLKLNELDLELVESPLEDLTERERKFYRLKSDQQFCRGYFVYMSKQSDHLLNLNLWNRMVYQIERDIKNLQLIAREVDAFKLAIEEAKVEEDLPKLEAFHELEEEIDKKFGQGRSPYHAKLRDTVIGLKDRVHAILRAKRKEAASVFQSIRDTFQGWRECIERIFEDFNRDSDNAFPWRQYPPSQKEIEALNWQLEQKKAEYQQWPCVDEVIPKEDFKLVHYGHIVSTMKSVTEGKINDAFKDPVFSTKKLQHYIKAYQNLLESVGDPNAGELCDAMKLRLFKFTHKQQRNNQWFSFFRRSYFDNLPHYDWHDVAINVFTHHYGYSGARSKGVLQTLGWMDGDQLTSLAPASLKARYQCLQEKSSDIDMKTSLSL